MQTSIPSGSLTKRLQRTSALSFLLILVVIGSRSQGAQGDNEVIEILLGSYEFIPNQIRLTAGQSAKLRLVNTDSIIPHNFTIEDNTGELDLSIDVPAGESVDIHLKPTRPGRYVIYCANKMLFMTSHRDHGMEGTLIVEPSSP